MFIARRRGGVLIVCCPFHPPSHPLDAPGGLPRYLQGLLAPARGPCHGTNPLHELSCRYVSSICAARSLMRLLFPCAVLLLPVVYGPALQNWQPGCCGVSFFAGSNTNYRNGLQPVVAGHPVHTRITALALRRTSRVCMCVTVCVECVLLYGDVLITVLALQRT